MMPPISGMQAIAAATLEGKPVESDFGAGSGPGLGGGSSSGMTYIHETTNVLSSNLATRCSSFRFHSGVKANIVPFNSNNYMTNNRSPRVYPNRSDRCDSDYRHPRRNPRSLPQ